MALPLPLVLASVAALAAPGRPAKEAVSPHAFRKLVESTRGSVVRLVDAKSTGVVIGIHGELLVPEEAAGKGPVAVEYKGARLQAEVRARDRVLGLALLSLPSDDYPAATVGASARLAPGSFLLGIAWDRAGKLSTTAGRYHGLAKGKGSPRLRAEVGGPPGFVVFNARGELVGVHVPRRRAVVPIDEVRVRFAEPRPEG